MTPRLLALAGAALLAAAPARAQSPADFLPAAPASPDLPERDAPASPRELRPVAPGGGASFVLRGVVLEGAAALSSDALAPVWAELIGTEVTLAALDAVAAGVAAEYRARGFVLSQALLPPQTVENGVVAIQVIEGFIGRVAVEGGARNQRAKAAELFAPLSAERPMRLPTLERGVLLARDLFGGGVDTVIAPSPATFGAADLTVALAPTPVTGFASVDNRGSRLYGAGSFVTGVTAFNRLGMNERLDLLGAGALDGSLGYVQGDFSAPLPGLAGTALDGATIELSASYADGSPDLSRAGEPRTLTLTTRDAGLRAGVRVPFVRTRSQNLAGEIGIEWRDSESVTSFGPDESAETDRLLTLDARLVWDRADRLGGVTLVEGGLRRGLGGEAGSGETDFTLGTLSLARLQRLGASPWSLWVEALGQYSADVLPNPERFSLGDSSIGRGFAPGAATGDSGLGGRLELRRQVDSATLRSFGEAAELYAYGDYGAAWDRDETRDGARRETLASAGIGLRLDLRPWLSLTPEIARQIEGTNSDTTEEERETRLFLTAVVRF